MRAVDVVGPRPESVVALDQEHRVAAVVGGVGGLHPPAAARIVEIVDREVVGNHVATPGADKERRGHVLEDVVLDEIVRVRIPFDSIALRLAAGSVEVIVPDLVAARHGQPHVIATAARSAGRRHLDGAYACDPTLRSDLDVDAAAALDRLYLHVLDYRSSKVR